MDPTAYLTEDQTRALALALRDSANALSQYLHDNWATMTPAEQDQLNTDEWNIRTSAYDLRTQLVKLELANLQTTIQNILAATAEAKLTLKRIENTARVLQISAALVALGVAITGPNPLLIAGAIGSLLAAVAP